MNLSLEILSKEEWKPMSELAHKISFGKDRPSEMDRIDYAMLIKNESDPCCYATLIEIDRDSVYMQHGGAFPNVEKSVYTVKGYFMFINWLKEQYKCISTKILNKNVAMIKLALSAGLEIIGVEFNDGDIFLNLMWKYKSTQ